jgi:predicted RNase H-like nuclease
MQKVCFMPLKTNSTRDGCVANQFHRRTAPIAAANVAIMRDATFTGVDGCAAGWVAVTLGPGSRPAATTVRIAVATTLDGLPLTGVTGIDMPLGLLDAGWRDADLLARQVLGRRGVTVFAIPPRPVWECETHAEANRVCRDLTGKGFSVQAWGLRRKIAEADEYRRRALAAPSAVQLYEVHPELSFSAIAGAPLPDSKHTAAGLTLRRTLLAAAGITLPARVAGAAEDDLLDAAAVAWSARRIAAGQAAILTSPAQRADDSAEIAIRY